MGIINHPEFAPTNSIEAVVWVAVGGRGTLAGAVVGAVVVNLLKTCFTANLSEPWLFALGGLFILVSLRLARGIVGSLEALAARRPAVPCAAATEASRACAGGTRRSSSTASP